LPTAIFALIKNQSIIQLLNKRKLYGGCIYLDGSPNVQIMVFICNVEKI